MRIIKVDAIESTNTFVRKFYEGGKDFEPVCVRAISQTAGRGQRGSTWLSNTGENLTFSILYPQNRLSISSYFLLSATISLAVLEVLEELEIPQLKVKWPNDILSAKQKLGGILIENILKTEGIVASVIGIGLNVNQTNFQDLPQAGSLKTVTGNSFDIDQLLERLVLKIESHLKNLPSLNKDDILKEYIKKMFRFNLVSSFEDASGKKFNGIIRGVTLEGKLKLETDDGNVVSYDLKEIRLLY